MSQNQNNQPFTRNQIEDFVRNWRLKFSDELRNISDIKQDMENSLSDIILIQEKVASLIASLSDKLVAFSSKSSLVIPYDELTATLFEQVTQNAVSSELDKMKWAMQNAVNSIAITEEKLKTEKEILYHINPYKPPD